MHNKRLNISRNIYIFTTLILAFFYTEKNMAQNTEYNELTPFEKHVIIDKGTESPFTGECTDHKEKGQYICKQCGTPLYQSDDKFASHCGWPSFDNEIEGSVKRIPDKDGMRTEIVCANCNGHLGHVFIGEGFTMKNTRHCVNSVSLDFVPAGDIKVEKAIFAGGCFWGVEYFMELIDGVQHVISGYTGGNTINPTYEDILTHSSGHYEAVEISFDPGSVSYETLAKTFFEIHDPTQKGRQGPDIGEQYQSAIFYINEEQKEIAQKLIQLLKQKNYNVTTQLYPASTFYPAEEYHQNYYKEKGSTPYCHSYTKRF